MRRLILIAGVIVAAGCLSASVAQAAWGGRGTRLVQVQRTALRAEPSFTAEVFDTLRYGQTVLVVELKGDWSRVRSPGGLVGWVHARALQPPGNLLLKSLSAPSGATSSAEVALAGKGFTNEVEQAYRDNHPDLNYEAVTDMEAARVDEASWKAFLAEGRLAGRGVGQ